MPEAALTAEEITRGRVDRLEICNFKSYGGKTVLGPFLDFTAVVGPNGAGAGHTPKPAPLHAPPSLRHGHHALSHRASVPGKSNCMDAVSFCTGVNSKDLRGKKLKDLIYRSTKDVGTGALLSRAPRVPTEPPSAATPRPVRTPAPSAADRSPLTQTTSGAACPQRSAPRT